MKFFRFMTRLIAYTRLFWLVINFLVFNTDLSFFSLKNGKGTPLHVIRTMHVYIYTRTRIFTSIPKKCRLAAVVALHESPRNGAAAEKQETA